MKRRGIHDVSARYMGDISEHTDPIWMMVQDSPRSHGRVFCLSRELAVKLRDCLNDALAGAPDDASRQLDLASEEQPA